MDKEAILAEMQAQFRGESVRARRYVGGLLPALAEFLVELRPAGKTYADLADLLQQFPLQTEGTSTLTVMLPSGVPKTIRPAYNRYHRLYIFENHRLDYPRAEPYATGKWQDYRHWLDAMVAMSDDELRWLADQSVAFVLSELPDQSFDPSQAHTDPPVFRYLLEGFDFNARARAEPTGAAFQAAVFGFIRADAPHLQVEARKARAGSARTKGIGDIDAWDGDRLVISAEVKSFTFQDRDAEGLTHFSTSIMERGSLGLVVALDFTQEARNAIAMLGLTALSRNDLLHIVSLWDSLKQRTALNAFRWVVIHREQNSGLIKRVADFLGVEAPSAG